MSECEWNPQAHTAANIDEPSHGEAVVSVGDGEWHLCASCAALPKFSRYRKTSLRHAGGLQGGDRSDG
jgi:hypothetical protein